MATKGYWSAVPVRVFRTQPLQSVPGSFCLLRQAQVIAEGQHHLGWYGPCSPDLVAGPAAQQAGRRQLPGRRGSAAARPAVGLAPATTLVLPGCCPGSSGLTRSSSSRRWMRSGPGSIGEDAGCWTSSSACGLPCSSSCPGGLRRAGAVQLRLQVVGARHLRTLLGKACRFGGVAYWPSVGRSAPPARCCHSSEQALMIGAGRCGFGARPRCAWWRRCA